MKAKVMMGTSQSSTRMGGAGCKQGQATLLIRAIIIPINQP